MSAETEREAITEADVQMLRGAAVNWPYENAHRFAELADKLAVLRARPATEELRIAGVPVRMDSSVPVGDIRFVNGGELPGGVLHSHADGTATIHGADTRCPHCPSEAARLLRAKAATEERVRELHDEIYDAVASFGAEVSAHIEKQTYRELPALTAAATAEILALLAPAVEREATEGDSVAGGLIRMADNHGLLAKERELLYHAARLLRGGETNPARVREREEAGDE